MLEHYFIRPETVDRIRSSWLGDAIETYVAWLVGQSYSSRCVIRRVPLLTRFGEFARKRGAIHIEELHGHLDAFVRSQLRRRIGPFRSKVGQKQYLRDVRRPIERNHSPYPGTTRAGRRALLGPGGENRWGRPRSSKS